MISGRVSADLNSNVNRRPGTIALTSSVAVERQDDVSGFVLGFDVLRRLDHVLQRIAPIDYRPELAGLDELLDEQDVLFRLTRRYLEHHPLGYVRPFFVKSSCV